MKWLPALFMFTAVTAWFVWSAPFDRSPAPLAASPAIQQTLIGIPVVKDGDSLLFDQNELRLDAIDAPESRQACRNAAHQAWPCGQAATDWLRTRLQGKRVTCLLHGRDIYKRWLGTCWEGEHSINAELVATGNAIAYHHFSDLYTPEEDAAKEAKRGIWQDPDFTEPYYCRHFHEGHTCYEYDFAMHSARIAVTPMLGRDAK